MLNLKTVLLINKINDISKFLNSKQIIWLVLLIGFQPFLFAGNNDSTKELFDKAEQAVANQEYPSAVIHYTKAFQIFLLNKEPEKALETKVKIALVAFEQDSLEKALDYISTAIDSIEPSLPPLSEQLAFAYHKKAVILYYLYRERDAIQAWKKAVAIREKHGQNETDVIKGYRYIGECYYFLNQPKAAIDNLEIAFQKMNAFPALDLFIKIEIYQLLGRLYGEYGDLDQAKKMAEHALESYQKIQQLSNRELTTQAIAYDEYGKILTDLYKFDEALSAFETSLSILGRDSLASRQAERANLYSNLGYCYLKKQEYKAALKAFKTSLSINKLLKNSTQIKDNQLNIGLTYNKLSKANEALSILKKLEKPAIDPYEKREQAYIQDNLGDTYFLLDQPQKALKSYNQSLAYLGNQTFDISDVYTTLPVQAIKIDKKGALTTLSSKAKVLHSIYRSSKDDAALKAAFTVYQKIDTLLTDIRQSFIAEGSKLSLASEMKPIYEAALSVCYQLWTTTGESKYKTAFYTFIEKSKGIALLDAVRHAEAKDFYAIGNKKEKELALQLKFLTEELFNKPEDKLKIEERLISLNKQRSAYIKYLENKHPKYYNYKYNGAVPSLSEISVQLDSNSVLVDYFIGEEKNYVLTISQKSGISVDTLPISPSELIQLVQSHNEALYSPFTDNILTRTQSDTIYSQTAYQLYKNLIAPLSILGQAKLIIIPDDVLNLVAFDALLTQPVPASFLSFYGNKEQYAFLLYDYQISYCYSVSLLKTMQTPPIVKGKNQLLAFHTLEFDNQIKELKNVFGQWNQFLYPLEENSRRATFQDIAQDYQYLHLSLHGVLNNEHPDQSHFIMRAKEKAKRPLYLGVLYNTSLKAEMVVTSSCDAGIGKLSRGEGVLSLARGFSYAGAQSIITSLWEIKDGPTGSLISDFYSALKEGLSKDKSLQQAKVQYIQTHDDGDAHPYYWAGFIPIGNMAAVDIPFIPSLSFKLGLGLCALILLSFIGKRWFLK